MENIAVKRNRNFTGNITFQKPLEIIPSLYSDQETYAFTYYICSNFYLEDILPYIPQENHSKLISNLQYWNRYRMSVRGIDVQHLLCLLISHHHCITQFLLSHLILRRALDLISHQCQMWHHLNDGEKHIFSISQKYYSECLFFLND